MKSGLQNHQKIIKESPFIALNLENQYDIIINCKGGGIKGQCDAIMWFNKINKN